MMYCSILKKGWSVGKHQAITGLGESWVGEGGGGRVKLANR